MKMAKGLVFGMYSQLILLMEISAMVIMVKWPVIPIINIKKMFNY